MFNKKSEYAQNKREKDSIIYISVNGRIRLTRSDFASEEEFLRWWSLRRMLISVSRWLMKSKLLGRFCARSAWPR